MERECRVHGSHNTQGVEKGDRKAERDIENTIIKIDIARDLETEKARMVGTRNPNHLLEKNINTAQDPRKRNHAFKVNLIVVKRRETGTHLKGRSERTDLRKLAYSNIVSVCCWV